MTFKILAIDGGGIRGIIPAKVLVRLETILGARIGDTFDMIAGTSTGAILTCGLLMPLEVGDQEGNNGPTSPTAKFSAQQLLDIYVNDGNTIFPPSYYTSIPFRLPVLSTYTYPASGIESVLKKYFSETQMCQLIKPCLVTAYDVAARKAMFFRQGSNFLVRDVLRASTSAPVYFPSAQIHSRTGIEYSMVDGGIVANNPAMCAWADALKRHKVKMEDIRILSIGCGTHSPSYSASELNKLWAIQLAKPVIDFLFDASSQTADFQLRQVFDSLLDDEKRSMFHSVCSPHYTRIDYKLGANKDDPKLDLDDASDENISRLLGTGQKIAEAHHECLTKFVKFMN
jgi:patatin-like phospholipase/acyl hydrolase